MTAHRSLLTAKSCSLLTLPQQMMEKNEMKSAKDEPECYIYAPKMKKFFAEKRENEALIWIPVECSLLFSYELQQLSTATKYIYVALLLLSGIRGNYEIPFRINYLAQTLGVDKRTVRRGIEELLTAEMLHQRERKTERTEKKVTAQTDKPAGCALIEAAPENPEKIAARCVDFNFFKKKSAEVSDQSIAAKDGGQLSAFTLAECLSYVQLCVAKGEDIRNPKGLATSLFQTGKSDAFIRAAMFPEDQKQTDLQTYGAPVRFSAEPCRVCFGAKMADADGKGYRKCGHCRNERGNATGFEPE
jgi:hypothetical protein